MKLRPYQQNAIDDIYRWWMSHPGVESNGIIVLPTGAGKSLVIAELVRLLWHAWGDQSPRTVVIVPSKELAEQNAAKLMALVPSHISIGFYSASLGKKRPDADIIVATIGSVAKCAHVLGNIRCVIVDECHLINPDGAGLYREFLRDLAKYCTYRVVGLTATPFRGNGIWLTSGKDPLFAGIAHETKVKTLLDDGYLSELVAPVDAVRTRVDTADVEVMSTGDYNERQLGEAVDHYIDAAADEAVELAADRRKWIAFTPTIATAEHLVTALRARGVVSGLVCGTTPKAEREELIARFRAGEIRCLVTVLALATGFDVPDVDCIIWLRPTVSPVLYVQGAGRGLRIAPGKKDCLWLDFTDTTERLGPVDAIRGRASKPSKKDASAPFCVCPECGHQVRPASALVCPECDATIREDAAPPPAPVSIAAVMEHQRVPKLVEYDIERVTFELHLKQGSPDSLRVEYWSGMRIVCKEWVCPNHTGFARARADAWFRQWSNCEEPCPGLDELLYYGLNMDEHLRRPTKILVNESDKYPVLAKVIEWTWIK